MSTHTMEPEIFLQYQEFGEWYSVPFPEFHIHDDQAFFDFCQGNAHSTLRFERESDGRVHLMPPSGSETGHVNAEILTELNIWNRQQGEPGYVFDSSAGFRLPNGAIRAPDISFVAKARYDALSDFDRTHYPPIAPDFVVEVMSPSDRIGNLQAKMEEYIDNGSRLGWLIDRRNRTVYVYRPGQAVETHVEVPSLSAAPELPGFTLQFARIF